MIRGGGQLAFGCPGEYLCFSGERRFGLPALGWTPFLTPHVVCFTNFNTIHPMAELVGNCLIGQSGGPSVVNNASVAGVVSEALNHGCVEEVYGALNGVAGILHEDLVDLAAESQQTIRGLRHTPGA